MVREEASRLSSPSNSPPRLHTPTPNVEASQLSSPPNSPPRLQSPTPNVEESEFDMIATNDEFEAEQGEEEDLLSAKIHDLIRDLPTPPLSLPLHTFPNPVTFTSTNPSLSFFDSSKLSALVTNSFQTNQLLYQVINLLQSLLYKMGSQSTTNPTIQSTSVPQTLPSSLATTIPSTLPLTQPTSLPILSPTLPLTQLTSLTTIPSTLPLTQPTSLLTATSPTTYQPLPVTQTTSPPLTTLTPPTEAVTFSSQPSSSEDEPDLSISGSFAVNATTQPPSGSFSPVELMRLASKSKTKGHFCCNVLRALFSPTELKGRSVYGSSKKTPLDRRRVEQIRQLAVTVYGEEEITEKVWCECVTSLNAHLRKYHKYDQV